MADGRHKKLPEPTETGTRERHGPSFSRSRFEATPEFEEFKAGMKRLLAVPKAVVDARVKAAKKDSPRTGNPLAPGRKKSKIH
jgi:hypothetical protein